MREADNIREVEQCEIDWMGFIFFTHSVRYIDFRPEYLPVHARRVGVFVNADFKIIIEKIQEFGLNLVQLHGIEPPETCLQLKQSGVKIIKAFAIRSAEDFQQTAAYTDVCDYFLFDTPCTGYGGSGKSFDWSLLHHYQGKIPFLLSGGIRSESLDQLIFPADGAADKAAISTPGGAEGDAHIQGNVVALQQIYSLDGGFGAVDGELAPFRGNVVSILHQSVGGFGRAALQKIVRTSSV